jgi:predicted phage terminase large subunit-like protein
MQVSQSYLIQGYDGIAALPASLKFYGASDYATMEIEHGKKEPDFTENGIVGVDHIGDWWFTDWFYKQCETDVGIRNFIRLVGFWKPIRWWNEGGIIDKAIGPAIRSAMRAKQTFTAIEMLPSIDDKSMKCQAFHARAHAKTIHFPLRRKWTDHVIDQLCKFPGGKHDDAVDVCGLLGRGIDKMHNASLPSAPRRDILVPFTEKWLEYKAVPDQPKVRFFS